MILHCSKKLAAKLPNVSGTPLTEASPLGSWHGHLVVMNRRQCALLCHDATRYVLFLPGMRKEHFAALDTMFRNLFFETLTTFGCTDAHVKKVNLALGPIQFDTATDRSVQGSLRIVQFDLEPWVWDAGDPLRIDPVEMSCKLSKRPASVRGKWIWPDKDMLALVQKL